MLCFRPSANTFPHGEADYTPSQARTKLDISKPVGDQDYAKDSEVNKIKATGIIVFCEGIANMTLLFPLLAHKFQHDKM